MCVSVLLILIMILFDYSGSAGQMHNYVFIFPFLLFEWFKLKCQIISIKHGACIETVFESHAFRTILCFVFDLLIQLAWNRTETAAAGCYFIIIILIFVFCQFHF